MPEHAALKDNVYPAAQPYGPTPAEPAALSAHVRPWVMLGALLLFFLFAYVCAHWVMRTELQKIVVAKESAMLGLMADDEITVQRLSTLAKNEALFVAATPPIQGIGRALAAGGRDPLDGTTQQAWLQRLAAIAQAYVTARPELFQVRLIGLADQGRELMRVEQNQAGQVRVVPPNELQQKGAYGYFKQALGLAPGQVALSPLDLNVEHGQIEMPPRPTLRASVAVRNASNQVFGVVVVNTHAAPLLSNISSTSLAGAVHWVSNAQGHYLVHPQVEQSFAYLLRPQTAKTFGQEFTLRPDGLAELGLVAQAGTQVMRGPGGQEWLMRSSTLLPAQADGQGGLVLHSGIPIKLLQVLAWQDGRAQLLLLWFEGGIVIGLLTFMLLHWRARTGLRSLRGAGLSEEGAAPKPAIALPLLGKQLALPITGNGLLIALSWGVLLPWAWWALLIFVPSTDSISFPFILGLLPVLLASWAGGLAAGLVATGISVVVGFDLATPSTPPLDWRGASLEVFVAAGITMVLGLLITFTQESVRRQGWRLTQANSRLARTVEATQLGFWEYELTNGRVSWSPEVLAFRGLREGEFDGTLAAAVQYTHPEDRERFAATARDARPNEPYAIEFRVLRPDGQIRWLEARGVLEANASGQPLRFVGTEVDITERKLAEAALRESNARFEALFSQ
ncbi:MAG: PAS domain-containing protein, partial [Hylemonella sp.]